MPVTKCPRESYKKQPTPTRTSGIRASDTSVVILGDSVGGEGLGVPGSSQQNLLKLLSGA